MSKWIALASPHDPTSFDAICREAAGPAGRVVLSCRVEGDKPLFADPRQAPTTMVELWAKGVSPGPLGFASLYGVDERIERDELPAGAYGPRLVAGWRRRPELDKRTAARLWDEHVPLALAVHRGAARYVRHRIVAAPVDAPPLDGIAILDFATEEDFRERRYVPPEADRLIAADIARFAETFWAILMRRPNDHS